MGGGALGDAIWFGLIGDGGELGGAGVGSGGTGVAVGAAPDWTVAPSGSRAPGGSGGTWDGEVAVGALCGEDGGAGSGLASGAAHIEQ